MYKIKIDPSPLIVAELFEENDLRNNSQFTIPPIRLGGKYLM